MAQSCEKCGASVEGYTTCPACGAPVVAAQQQQYQYAQAGQSQQYQQTAGDYQQAQNGYQQSEAPNVGQTFMDQVNAPGEYMDPVDVEANKMWGALAYILFFLPLLGAPKSRFGRFHANQGLVFLLFSFVVGVVIGILQVVLGRVPVIPFLLSLITYVVPMFFFLFGVINAISGKAKKLPLIGGITLIKTDPQ